MPPQNGKRQQQTGRVSEPGLLRDHMLWLDMVASVNDKDKLGGKAAEEKAIRSNYLSP